MASPYIVSVEDLSLREADGGNWHVSLSVTGYYIPDQTETVSIYTPFSAYNKYEETMEILRQKSEKLEN